MSYWGSSFCLPARNEMIDLCLSISLLLLVYGVPCCTEIYLITWVSLIDCDG